MDIYNNTNRAIYDAAKAYRSILVMGDDPQELKETTLLLYPDASSSHMTNPSLQNLSESRWNEIFTVPPISNTLPMDHQDHGDEKDDDDEDIDDDEFDEDEVPENGDGDGPDEEEGDEDVAGEEEHEDDDSELEEDEDEFDDDEYDLDEDDDDEDDYDEDVA